MVVSSWVKKQLRFSPHGPQQFRTIYILREKWSKRTLGSHINPLMTNVPHHIETSQLIVIANQLTVFYMMDNIGR